jgi:hypothetical protein
MFLNPYVINPHIMENPFPSYPYITTLLVVFLDSVTLLRLLEILTKFNIIYMHLFCIYTNINDG